MGEGEDGDEDVAGEDEVTEPAQLPSFLAIRGNYRGDEPGL